MASRTYISTTSRRTPRPRSKRLRECGGGTYVTGGSVTYVSGGTSSGSSGGTSSGDITELREELDALRTELEECCSAANTRIGELQDAVDSLRDMLGVVTFTIVPTPADATVTINGRERTAIEVFAGTTVTWSVEADGHITRTGSQEVTGDTTIEVVLADIGSLISSFSYDDIGAGGGTVLPKVEVLEGAALTYSGTGVDPATGAVGADSLGTTAKDRTRVTTVTLTAELNGSTATAAAEVYQEKNEIVKHEAAGTTYSGLAITGGHTYDDIEAGGGTVTPTAPTYSQTATTAYTDTYTSGATAQGEPVTETITSGAALAYSGTGVDTSTGAVTASSLGTTEKARSVVATATVTVTLNGESAGRSTDVYQAQNIIESESSGTTYSVPAVSLSYEVDGVEGEDIPAGGGTAKPVLSYSQTKTTGHSYTYSSGEVRTSDGETETITGGGTATYSGTGVASDGTVTASSLGTTVKDRTAVATATVTVTLNDETGPATAAVYQEANVVETEREETTYGAPYILDLKWDDIPAWGGTVTPTFSVEQEAQTRTHRTYTSGATEDAVSETHGADTSGAALTFTASAGSADIDGTTGAVTAGSLGTEERERTLLGTYTVTAECNGVSSAAYTGEVWQEANVRTITATVTNITADFYTVGWSLEEYNPKRHLAFTWSRAYTSGSSEDGSYDGIVGTDPLPDGFGLEYETTDNGSVCGDGTPVAPTVDEYGVIHMGPWWTPDARGTALSEEIGSWRMCLTADGATVKRVTYTIRKYDTLIDVSDTVVDARTGTGKFTLYAGYNAAGAEGTVVAYSEAWRIDRSAGGGVTVSQESGTHSETITVGKDDTGMGNVIAVVGETCGKSIEVTVKLSSGKPEIWFADDPAATEKTIELQADGSAITVPVGWSEETTHMEIDADYWGTKADGMLSVVVQGYTYNDYVSGGRVGSPMIYIDEPTGELTHPTRVLFLSATDDGGGAGNTLRININISG